MTIALNSEIIWCYDHRRKETDKPVVEGNPIIEFIPGHRDYDEYGFTAYNGLSCSWDAMSEHETQGTEPDWDNYEYAECPNDELEYYVARVFLRKKGRAIPLKGGKPGQMEMVYDTDERTQIHDVFCVACALRLGLVTQSQVEEAGVEAELEHCEAEWQAENG